MKTRTLLSAAALLAITAALPARAQSVGDWVLANYQGSGYWFAGVVNGVEGDMVTVKYDDDEYETLRRGQVRPYTWRVGTRVECNWKRRGAWYPGKITALDLVDVSIAYDDGDKERTHTGQCRSR